jgi:hypothetical protein
MLVASPSPSPRPEDFPNSPYAYELAHGVAKLRFAAPLERGYEISHLRWARARVRVWFSVAFALSISFPALRTIHAGLATPLAIAQVFHIVLGRMALR